MIIGQEFWPPLLPLVLLLLVAFAIVASRAVKDNSYFMEACLKDGEVVESRKRRR